MPCNTHGGNEQTVGSCKKAAMVVARVVQHDQDRSPDLLEPELAKGVLVETSARDFPLGISKPVE